MIIRSDDQPMRSHVLKKNDLSLLLKGKDLVSQHFRRKQILQSMMQASSQYRGKILTGHTDRIIYIDPVPNNNLTTFRKLPKPLLQTKEERSISYAPKQNDSHESIKKPPSPPHRSRKNFINFLAYEFKENNSSTTDTMSLYFNAKVNCLPLIKPERSSEKKTSIVLKRSTLNQENDLILTNNKSYSKPEIKTIKMPKKERKNNKSIRLRYQKQETKHKKGVFNQIVQTFDPINDVLETEVDHQSEDDFCRYVLDRHKAITLES